MSSESSERFTEEYSERSKGSSERFPVQKAAESQKNPKPNSRKTKENSSDKAESSNWRRIHHKVVSSTFYYYSLLYYLNYDIFYNRDTILLFQGRNSRVPRDRIYFDPRYDDTLEIHSNTSVNTSNEVPSLQALKNPEYCLTVPPNKLLVKDVVKKDHRGKYTLERHIKLADDAPAKSIVDMWLLKYILNWNESILSKHKPEK